MKRRNDTGLSVLYIIACLAVNICSLVSQVNSPTSGAYKPTNLTGSKLKLEEIATKADSVFVGQIVELGDPTPSSPGVASYGVTVKTLQVLRGSVDGQITVTIDTFALNSEGPPQAGNSYIFFAHKVNGEFEAYKLLPATDANVTKVKSAIAAAPSK